MKKKVALNINGLPASTVTISYTTYHTDVELPNVEAKAQYERRTNECSSKAHIDVHENYLDVVDLSRQTTDASTKGSSWYGVKTVNVFVERRTNHVTYHNSAKRSKGGRALQRSQ